jgi:hypothetical protein
VITALDGTGKKMSAANSPTTQAATTAGEG